METRSADACCPRVDALTPKPLCVALLAPPRTYRLAPFVAAARKLGLDVVLGVDLHRELADFWSAPLPLDFADAVASTQRIVALAETRPLAAIVAVDDGATVLSALASQALGLPHNDPGAAVAARDKRRMREMLHSAGVPSPGYLCFPLDTDPAAAAECVRYPCVVKPPQLSGSRGVIRANNPEEFVRAFNRTAAIMMSSQVEGDELLVEEFVPGVEVALEGLLVDADLRVLALFDKPDPLDGPFFEETIYVTPSRLPEQIQTAITACASRAAAALGLRHGPVHAELRVNEDGPWIVEIAGRSIGGLCSRTLGFRGGVSLEELILAQACGLPIEPTRHNGATGVMMIPIPGSGVLRRVQGIEAAHAVPLVDDVVISVTPGYPLIPLPEGESYLGFIFASGPGPAEVEAALRTAHTKLSIRIDPEIRVFQ